MEPMVHYIPLRKDFSNFDEVVRLIRDDDVCRELAENAYRDLIASGEWSYAKFVAGVDATLDEAIAARLTPEVEAAVERRLSLGRAGQRRRRVALAGGVRWLGCAGSGRAPRDPTSLHPVTARHARRF